MNYFRSSELHFLKPVVLKWLSSNGGKVVPKFCCEETYAYNTSGEIILKKPKN